MRKSVSIYGRPGMSLPVFGAHSIRLNRPGVSLPGFSGKSFMTFVKAVSRLFS